MTITIGNIRCNTKKAPREVKCSGIISFMKNIKGTSNGIMMVAKVEDLRYRPNYRKILHNKKKCTGFIFSNCQNHYYAEILPFTEEETNTINGGVNSYALKLIYEDAPSHL